MYSSELYTKKITVKPVSHQSCGTYDLAILAWGTERRDPEADRRHFRKNHRERKAAVRCSYDYLTFTCKAVARRSCEIWKIVVGQSDTSYDSLAINARLSCDSLAAFLRQNYGWRTIASVVRTPCVPYSCLTTALRALRLSCILQKTHRNRKKNENVKYLVFDVAAAMRLYFFVGQSCGVVNNTLRLSCETQKFDVARRHVVRASHGRSAVAVRWSWGNRKILDGHFGTKIVRWPYGSRTAIAGLPHSALAVPIRKPQGRRTISM